MNKDSKLTGDSHDLFHPDTPMEVDGIGNDTAHLFNSAIGASVIAAIYELGLLDELQQNSSIQLEEFCDKRDLHHASMSALLHVLHCSEIIEINSAGDVVRKGPMFSSAYRDKGYFLWLVCGYGYLLQHFSLNVKDEARTGDFIQRSRKYIAAAARDYGSRFVDPHFADMLKQVPFQVAADLGCGSAERLINLARSQPDFRGVGTDISVETVELAKRAVEAANLQDRITVIHGDVRELAAQPELSQVEVLFSFFMGHDLWPRSNCLQTLRQLRSVFPRAKRLLLCDTYRSDLPLSRDIPIFTLGFELTHAVVAQYIPSVSEWMDLFEEAGWICVEQRDVGIPFSCIFDLRSGDESNEIRKVSPPVEGFRLSPQQQRLWLQQADLALPYRVQAAISIEGKLDAGNFKAAIAHVVEKHEILRTTFAPLPGSGIPVQVINETLVPLFQEHDFSAYSAQAQQPKIGTLIQEAFKRPFDFDRGPLLHFSLITLSAENALLLVVLPALCADGVGLNYLVREIGHSYAARLRNEELSGEVAQYADIAEWQNEILEAEDGKIGRAFWQKQDTARLLGLGLPFEKQPSGKPGFEPKVINSTFDLDMVLKIQMLAQQHETSTATLLLACWQILLWRLTGQKELVIGIAHDGREYDELKEVLGLFEKYLPLICNFEANGRLSDLLAQVHESVEEIYKQQEFFSWEQMTKSTGNDVAPLFFPICFAFEAQALNISSAEVSFTTQQQYVCVDRFKMKLVCVQRDETLEVQFHYDTNLFQDADIQRLAGQFRALVRSVIDSPDATSGELQILSDAERQTVLVEFNDTQADYPKDKTIQQLIEEQAGRTPEAIAVVFEDQQLSYAALNARANQLAHHLQALGVGPNILIAICLERSLELVVGILGILKAGGAYVPLDPTYPKERLAFMFEDSGAQVLLTEQRLGSELPEQQEQASPEQSRKVLYLDTTREAMVRESEQTPAAGVTPHDLAYVIYTSGSTGKPKGVIVTHQNLVSSNSARTAYYNEPVGKFLLLSSVAFDSSVVGIFWTLCRGGTLLLVREDLQKNPSQLAELIAEQRVSHLLTLPSYYGLILEHAKSQQLGCLGTVIVAGEPCPKTLVDRHKELLRGTSLFSEYGATETTVFSSVYDCYSQRLGIAPIGRPIANAQIYLLDLRLQPVPIGVPGEVYFGGDGLAQGYLNRPELTAEKFIPNPFSKTPGARLYKSGDLARHLPDGDVEFLGRIDDQVKIRGYRIELGEIEATLSQHPAVQEAVVVAKPASEWQPQISKHEGNGAIDHENAEYLVTRMLPLGQGRADQLLAEIENLSEDEVKGKLPAVLQTDFDARPEARSEIRSHLEQGKGVPPRVRSFSDFDISLQVKNARFINPPRESQRNWLINQALNEFSDDLMHLNEISKRFVPGTEFKYEAHASDISQANLDEQELMEDWQIAVVKSMVKVVTEAHGDVLEIGFGRGVSATCIQESGVKSHTIVESNDHVVGNFYEPWKDRYPDKDIRLVHGRWQDVVDQLDIYDGIFFHTFPLNEEEFVKYVVDSITFAEHFFPIAAAHLREGGVFTYVTTEIDSLSRRHQRLVFQYFGSFTLSVETLSIPEDTKDLWWADSMVIVKAIK